MAVNSSWAITSPGRLVLGVMIALAATISSLVVTGHCPTGNECWPSTETGGVRGWPVYFVDHRLTMEVVESSGTGAQLDSEGSSSRSQPSTAMVRPGVAARPAFDRTFRVEGFVASLAFWTLVVLGAIALNRIRQRQQSLML